MTLIFVLLFFVYFSFAVMLLIGWMKTMAQKVPDGVGHKSLLSVVIPVRNESKGILQLLTDIQNQSYKNFEVIVVDDNSTDNTMEIVLSFSRQDTRFVAVRSFGEGKKLALTKGIEVSQGEIIITTDGDCRVKEDWLKSILTFFQQESTVMIFGGVKLEGPTFFSCVQAHEFLSLIGTAAATMSLGFPSFCNGANLAFRKAVFFEVGGYTNNIHIPSGDDEFLMRKVFQRYPNGIRFISDPNAIVKTSASASLKELVHQRIRWAGKWRHNLSFRNAALAIFIFYFQFSVIVLPIAAWMGWIDPGIALSLWLAKVLIEWTLLKKVADYLDVYWRWTAFFVLQLVYPFYAVLIGLISTFSAFEWKGRKLKSVTLSMVKK
jgi:biofilm PGA synthesis N-glycosyltransferase PgaC